MRGNPLVIFAAIALAACSSDQRSIAPSAPALDKGVASPNTVVNLKASYSTFVPTFYNDGRRVPRDTTIQYPLSAGTQAPSDIDHLDDCVTTWTTRREHDWMTVCVFRATGNVSLWATCGSYFPDGPLPYPAVLTAFAFMVPTVSYETWIWLSPGRRVVSDSVKENVVLGNVPEPIFSQIFTPVLAAISFPFPPGGVNRIGFLMLDKTVTDIPHDPSMWDAALVLPLSAGLQNHPACRGPDREIPVVIPFTETANSVSTPSGNRNLIFVSSVGETALHYNANKGVTTGTGSLLSDDGRYVIDLSQFNGSTLPIIDQMMTGPGAHARACLTAKPEQCTDVTLLRQ